MSNKELEQFIDEVISSSSSECIDIHSYLTDEEITALLFGDVA